MFNDTPAQKINRLLGVKQMVLKEGNVLFNSALNTFYFLLYGVGLR